MDIYMIILTILFASIIIYGCTYIKEEKHFLKKEQTDVLKGICCIIVILVHIPLEYSNRIQDAIGSFGYICVAIFFMLSAYGLRYSIENKENYLTGFFKKRVLILLIPFFLVNLLQLVLERNVSNIERTIFTILGLQGMSFITVLLILYIAFYIIYKYVKNSKYQDIIMCVVVIIYAILGRFTNLYLGWYVEQLGFAFGIILFHMKDKIEIAFKDKYWIRNFGIFFISVIIGILYVKYKKIPIIGDYFLRIVLEISLLTFVVTTITHLKIGNKITQYLGMISYEIYLLHTVVISALSGLMIPSGIYISLVIVITILGASLLKCVDRKIQSTIINIK